MIRYPPEEIPLSDCKQDCESLPGCIGIIHADYGYCKYQAASREVAESWECGSRIACHMDIQDSFCNSNCVIDGVFTDDTQYTCHSIMRSDTGNCANWCEKNLESNSRKCRWSNCGGCS